MTARSRAVAVAALVVVLRPPVVPALQAQANDSTYLSFTVVALRPEDAHSLRRRGRAGG